MAGCVACLNFGPLQEKILLKRLLCLLKDVSLKVDFTCHKTIEQQIKRFFKFSNQTVQHIKKFRKDLKITFKQAKVCRGHYICSDWHTKARKSDKFALYSATKIITPKGRTQSISTIEIFPGFWLGTSTLTRLEVGTK